MTGGVELVRTALPEGPTLLCLRSSAAHTANVSVHVRVGPRYENAEQAGISHFLEHMLHRGTVRNPSAHAQALAFEEVGATLGATTYVDHGVLSANAPPENVERVIELLADVCQNPIYDAIEIERGIVREELLEELDDAGRCVDADYLVRAWTFPRHALGLAITGTLDTLKTFDETALRAHHEKHYTKDLVVSVAGRIDTESVIRAVERNFRLFPPRPLATEPVAASLGPKFHYVRHPGSQTSLRFGFRAPGEHDALEPATELLLRVLDDGMSTRLYHRLCDERGLCYDVSAAYEAYGEAGLFDISADTSHAQVLTVVDEIFGILGEIKTHGPAERELEKAKARFAWQLAEIADAPNELTAFYGLGELSGVARTPEQRRDELGAIGREQVRIAATALFSAQNLALIAVGSLPRRARTELEHRLERWT